ncbi:MAG: hypothetical protein M3P50_11640 [Actinomycetota bacterium]|nr:hypothetical protein [Actinomycetota bacterium]
MLTYLIALAVQGLIVGALARLALPGRDPLSLFQTMAVGLAGTFIAGALLYALGTRGPVPFFAGFVVSVIIMYLIRRRRGGGLTSPSAANPRRPGPYER